MAGTCTLSGSHGASQCWSQKTFPTARCRTPARTRCCSARWRCWSRSCCRASCQPSGSSSRVRALCLHSLATILCWSQQSAVVTSLSLAYHLANDHEPAVPVSTQCLQRFEGRHPDRISAAFCAAKGRGAACCACGVSGLSCSSDHKQWSHPRTTSAGYINRRREAFCVRTH